MNWLFHRRPQSDTLVGSGIKDSQWLLQLGGVILFLVLIISGYIYFAYNRPGNIEVYSNPSGAEIFIDRQTTGLRTPAIVKSVKPKYYMVEVVLDSLIPAPYAHAINVESGKTVSISFLLRRPSEVPAPKPTANNPNTQPNVVQPTQPDYTSVLRDTFGITRRDHKRFPSVGGSGRIYVTSNLPGAEIYLDGMRTAQTTDAWLLAPIGTHRVQVRKEGFTVDPAEQSVFLSEAFQEQRAHFVLNSINTVTSKTVTVITRPIEGLIRVDGKEGGLGKWTGDLKFGAHLLEFASVTGYITPPPMKIVVTQTDPSQDILVNYRIGYAVELRIDQNGRPVGSNLMRWVTGIRHPDIGGFKVDADKGPKIVNVKQLNHFAWEFGMAFPNRNPVGGQFIQIEFDLPRRDPNDPPMFLWLQAMQSNRNYPLTFVNRTAAVIEVNNRVMKSEWAPSRTIDTTDPEGWERHVVADRLIEGKNTIRIYSSDNNLRYFYLSGVRIGPQPDMLNE
ncbi:MAG: PEGA domain-containing protein [bacterium]|nr:PEGA domain-containing protein [bacterium]